MFSKIRKRLTYANVAMTLALVFAMSGGAYAASKYIITSTKQIKPSVLKSLKGKAGATGLAGAQGAQGLKGETGAAGASVTGKEGPEGKAGKEGEKGKEGSPWTAGGTLPSGKTEKGDWSVTASVAGGGFAGVLTTAVSFVIPLGAAPVEVHLIPAPPEGTVTFPTPPPGCTGNVTEPGAEKGHLCIFAREEGDLTSTKKICPTGSGAVYGNPGTEIYDTPLNCLTHTGGAEGIPEGADPFGFEILVLAEAAGAVRYSGTWAVTEA